MPGWRNGIRTSFRSWRPKGLAGSSPASGISIFGIKKSAGLVEVGNNTLIKMESGENQNSTLDTLKKVAKALGVSIEELIK